MLALFIRFGVPILIQILQKTGAANWAERVAIKFGSEVIESVENLQTTDEFPSEDSKGQK